MIYSSYENKYVAMKVNTYQGEKVLVGKVIKHNPDKLLFQYKKKKYYIGIDNIISCKELNLIERLLVV